MLLDQGDDSMAQTKSGHTSAVAVAPDVNEELTPEALAAVEAHYAFRQPDEVTAYLRQYPYLVPTLLEAAERVPGYFGEGAPLFLKIFTDLGEDDPGPELFATVQIAFPPKEALARLDRFDADWWTMASPDGPAVLVVDIAYGRWCSTGLIFYFSRRAWLFTRMRKRLSAR